MDVLKQGIPETYQMSMGLAMTFISLEVISRSSLSSSVGCCLCLYCDTVHHGSHLHAFRLRWSFSQVAVLHHRIQRLLLKRDEPSVFGMDLSGVIDRWHPQAGQER
jgi:hypothetical protein